MLQDTRRHFILLLILLFLAVVPPAVAAPDALPSTLPAGDLSNRSNSQPDLRGEQPIATLSSEQVVLTPEEVPD